MFKLTGDFCYMTNQMQPVITEYFSMIRINKHMWFKAGSLAPGKSIGVPRKTIAR